MVLRALLLLAASVGVSLLSASACDLQTATNQTSHAGYIENVQTCLRTLPNGYSFDEAIELDNVRRVNDARAKRGLPRLAIRRDLRETARWHSMDMAANKYFSHRGKDNRSHSQRISLLDRTLLFDAARENIAMMRGDIDLSTESKTLHDLLMESEGHYKNIMADNVSHIAVGVVRFDDGVWLTQLFVNEAGEFSAPVPTRLTPGQTLDLDTRLRDWTFAGFQAEQGNETKRFKTNRSDGRSVVPRVLYGDVRIGVRGEKRPTSEQPRGFYINLSGPSATILAPR